MKFIQKGDEPALLRQWRLENQSAPQNYRYHNVPKEALAEVRVSLLKEQGFLCAYTTLRIKDESGGHIEHLRARSPEENPERDDSVSVKLEVAYSNFLYCYPGSDDGHCEYGAKYKDNTSINVDNFVSPLEVNCEQRFCYRKDGVIFPTGRDDPAAKATIAILNLNHDDLKSRRENAIVALPIFAKTRRPLTAALTRKALSALDAKDRFGRFQPFTPALRQFLSAYFQRRETRERALKSRPSD